MKFGIAGGREFGEFNQFDVGIIWLVAIVVRWASELGALRTQWYAALWLSGCARRVAIGQIVHAGRAQAHLSGPDRRGVAFTRGDALFAY